MAGKLSSKVHASLVNPYDTLPVLAKRHEEVSGFFLLDADRPVFWAHKERSQSPRTAKETTKQYGGNGSALLIILPYGKHFALYYHFNNI